MKVAPTAVTVSSALVWPLTSTRSPIWSGCVSATVSLTSHGELVGSVIDFPSAAIRPSMVGFLDIVGCALIDGVNSSTVMIVTTSVGELLMLGPSW